MIDFRQLDAASLAKTLDFSILPKETTEAEIREGCAITRQYGFAAFYTSSAFWTPLVCDELAGMSDVEIGTGIAFPFGSAPAAVKAYEVEDAVRRGCTTVDMVMNIGALKSGQHAVVADELQAFKQAAGDGGDEVHSRSVLLDQGSDRDGQQAGRGSWHRLREDVDRPV